MPTNPNSLRASCALALLLIPALALAHVGQGDLQGGFLAGVEHPISGLDHRNGPRKLDSAVSEIFIGFQAASLQGAWSKYTVSGVRPSSAL
jgi:hypothetical protein